MTNPNDQNALDFVRAKNKDKLYEALFTMADTWCPDIDEFRYKEFFGQLDYRLKYTGMADNTAYDVL